MSLERREVKAVDWFSPWDRVLDFEPPAHRWFSSGMLNATVSCIDRHVDSDRRNRAALIWIGESGERAYTYNRLQREVNRFANALNALGEDPGDTSTLAE